mmetsp:Transcript_73882/g.131093  ORF Transcript_73882/g.131093 Transcript_73882/m.131093 type:complete len:293 (+) Transcript_73882:73-951(+)
MIREDLHDPFTGIPVLGATTSWDSDTDDWAGAIPLKDTALKISIHEDIASADTDAQACSGSTSPVSLPEEILPTGDDNESHMSDVCTSFWVETVAPADQPSEGKVAWASPSGAHKPCQTDPTTPAAVAPKAADQGMPNGRTGRLAVQAAAYPSTRGRCSPKFGLAINMAPMNRARHMDLLDEQYLNDHTARRPLSRGADHRCGNRRLQTQPGRSTAKTPGRDGASTAAKRRPLGPHAVMPIVKGQLHKKEEAQRREAEMKARESKLKEQFRSHRPRSCPPGARKSPPRPCMQ